MRRYEKPVMQVERFCANVAVAGCAREVTGQTETVSYPAQKVTCEIGGQTEYVFASGTSGCASSATKTALGYYGGTYYFCWKASIGGTSATPSNSQKALMASVTGVSDPQGWHYCAVSSISTYTDILGLSW